MLAGLSSFVIYGIQSRGDYNEFYFNSISIPSRDIGPVFQGRYAKAFYLRSGSDNTIKNNIFINLSYNDDQIYVIHQYTSDSTNVFDSNILRYSEFNPVPQYPIKLARSGSDNYYTIPEWQATGNGLNSKYMLPEFTDIESDLHLGGCSVTNPDLLGLPISGINTDLDDDPRSAIQPMIGMGLFAHHEDFTIDDESGQGIKKPAGPEHRVGNAALFNGFFCQESIFDEWVPGVFLPYRTS